MRKYSENKKANLIEAVCNSCGRMLTVENGELKEGCFCGNWTFGYFSSMDGENHSFDLCEDCYRKMIQKFAVPVHVEEVTELL